MDETIVKQSKELIDKVLSYIVTISDDVTFSKTFCGVGSYSKAIRQCIRLCGKKISILHKRKPCEINIYL